MLSLPSLPSTAEPEPAPAPSLQPANLIPMRLPGPGQDNSLILPWVQPAMCWNGHLVIDRYGPPLPAERCCQCNASSDRTIRKTYSSTASGALLLMLVFPLLLPLALAAMFLSKSRASVEFGICHRCANRRLLRLGLGVAVLITSAPLFVQSFLAGDHTGFWWAIAGLLCFALGAVITASGANLGSVKRIDNRWVILKAGGKPFHDSLPQSPIPQF